MVLQLGRIGLVGNDLAAQLAELARLRNVLAHQYLDIRWEMLSRLIQEGEELVDRFTAAVEEKIR